MEMGAQAARRPAGKITEAFADDAARQGAYGLLESKLVSPEEIGRAVSTASALRSADYPFVFCPVDGTSLTLVDHCGGKDFGPIGTRGNGARGLKVMNAMVLSPRGVPLGVGAQEWWTRTQCRRRKTPGPTAAGKEGDRPLAAGDAADATGDGHSCPRDSVLVSAGQRRGCVADDFGGGHGRTLVHHPRQSQSSRATGR